jgi:hypothetical protein
MFCYFYVIKYGKLNSFNFFDYNNINKMEVWQIIVCAVILYLIYKNFISEEHFASTIYDKYSNKDGLNGDIAPPITRNSEETTDGFIKRISKICDKGPNCVGFVLDVGDDILQVPNNAWIKRCDGCVSAIDSLSVNTNRCTFIKK